MSDKLLTAEEFLSQKLGKTPIGILPEALIDFAKLHVTQALKAVTKIDFEDIPDNPLANDYEEARDLAILSAYPLELIK